MQLRRLKTNLCIVAKNWSNLMNFESNEAIGQTRVRSFLVILITQPSNLSETWRLYCLHLPILRKNDKNFKKWSKFENLKNAPN